MSKREQKKYFIKDESLRGVDGDMFNYSDIAQVLDDIISTNEPPYNVAIIGKWGLGKSSLINLVTQKYRDKNSKYQIQEINAWKYEKESLRKVFLKQLWQGVSKRKVHSFETVKREIANIINEELPERQNSEAEGRTKKFFITLGLILGLSVFAFIIYKIVQACSVGTSIKTWEFWTHVFLRYCKNVSTVLIGPILVALCKLLIDDYHAKQTKKIELNFPIETTDDYEIFLETQIKEQLDDNPELKIITVIDDLDRLSIEKIVEALDALKAFVGFKRCIFVVPFDDEIIKCALDKQRTKDYKSWTEVTDVIESEFILDKLFQFKIYLPPILEFDIQQYAYKLVQQEIPDFMDEYCNESLMKKVIERILIYPGVTTPRQVKKLINAFINNIMIVSARENSGKIQRGLLTSEDGIMQIAKMSVLQADFNDFYDLLFKDMRCIGLILSAHKGDKIELPKYLKGYFEKNCETFVLKNEHETLVNFLHRTEKYQVNSIAPYLYLAQDEISIKTGDELHRRAINALKSRNPQTLNNILKDSLDLAEVILYQLSKDNKEISDMLWVTMMVYKDNESLHKTYLAQCIIERVIELRLFECEFLYNVPVETIFLIANKGEKEEFNHQFKEKYLSVLSDESLFNKELLSEALEGIFENITSLNEDAKVKLKDICVFCCENDNMDAKSLFDVVKPEKEEFVEYWGIKWFEKICTYMDSMEDFSEVPVKQMQLTFNVLLKNISVDKLVEYMLPLVQYSAFLPVMDSIINQKSEGDNADHIKKLIGKNIATELLNKVIKHDFDRNEKVICQILDGLNYEVTENNSEEMDEFTLNYTSTNKLDNILVYCGEKGYFELLPKTIKDITKSIFEDGGNDNLLSKVALYYTESQILELKKKLLDASAFRSNKDYERELSIIKIMSSFDIYNESLENIVDTKIIPQYSSYYSHENYREYTSNAMGLIKERITQQCMDKYIKMLISHFNSYPKSILEAIEKVPMKMSQDVFKTVFQKITTDTKTEDFESAFEIIQNHNTIIPEDSENLHRYIVFLVNNLPTAENPDFVLRTICCSFSKISILQEMAVNAQKNPECSAEALAKAIAHFIKSKKIEEISSTIIGFCEAGISANILHSVISKIKNYRKDRIYDQLSNEVNRINSSQVLVCLSDIAYQDLNVISACKLVINCLQRSFEKLDLIECSRIIMENITKNSIIFKEHKILLAEVLREGFITTTSDNLKHDILLVVCKMKIKPQFKKTLTGEKLEYYKNWTS